MTMATCSVLRVCVGFSRLRWPELTALFLAQDEVETLKMSTKTALADAKRAKAALREASSSVVPEESLVPRKRVASPVKASKTHKEKSKPVS